MRYSFRPDHIVGMVTMFTTVVAREGGRSSIPETVDGIEKPRRAGHPACAGCDGQRTAPLRSRRFIAHLALPQNKNRCNSRYLVTTSRKMVQKAPGFIVRAGRARY